ncbi:MAG TPA: hypothetical protein VEO95_05260, partial [Chthoniobacteraceae bacterium]|nr:hypothetical protein [Chthoniobacteraceae bacterium]
MNPPPQSSGFQIRPAILAALLLAISLTANASPPPGAWSDKITDPAALDKAWHEVPPALRTAVEFQKLLLKIRGGAPVAEWKPQMEKFASAPGDDGVIVALRDVAKIWLARAAMEQIDAALRKFYRKQVRFPDTLAEVQRDIPAEAQRDPWGEAWTFAPAAPKGFAIAKQRYQLGPARLPRLSTLEDAVKSKPAAFAWKITPRDKALELRGADGKAAILQPGGRAGEIALVFIGDGWALL